MDIAGARPEHAGVRRLLRSLSLVDLSVLASSSMAPAYSIAAVMGLVVAAAGVGAPLAVIVSTIPITFVAIGFMRLSMAKPWRGPRRLASIPPPFLPTITRPASSLPLGICLCPDPLTPT